MQLTKRADLLKRKETIRKRYAGTEDDELDKEQIAERDQFKGMDSGDESEEIGEVFIYPCFLKPSKTNFLFGTPESDFFLHQFLVPQRIDPIPENVKVIRTLVKVRKFERHNSVFKDWVEDNPTIISNCMDHDM